MMEFQRIELPERVIGFKKLGDQAELLGQLSLVPLAVNTERPGVPQGDLVEVDIKFEDGRLSWREGDYLAVGTVERLLDGLIQFQNRNGGTIEVGTVEGAFEMTMEWREAHSDILLKGWMPQLDVCPRLLELDPLFTRNMIKTQTQFEFWLKPEDLASPIAMLRELLAHLKSV